MSEEHTISPIPAPCRKRRCWIVAMMTVLVACGAVCWWQNRLTPDEQIFVGRWEVILDPSVKTTSIVLEFHGNRTSRSISGKRLYWSANEGRVYFLEDRAVHKRLRDLFDRMMGRGGIPPQIVLHYEIVNRDKITTSSIEAPSKTVGILQRIVEK